MCGRFTTWHLARIEWRNYSMWAFIEKEVREYGIRESQNACPGELHSVIDAGGLRDALWGIDTSFSKRPLINARLDKLDSGYWKRLMGRRCLVPAVGWYEWDADKQPWLINVSEEPVICLAAVANEDQFAIITTDAIPDTAHMHPRMPVVVPPEVAERWLSPDMPAAEAIALITPPIPSGRLNLQKVDWAINKSRGTGVGLFAE